MAYKTEVYRGCRIVLEQDTDPQNPRKENENAGKMLCLHRRYDLGDKHDFKTPEEIVASLFGDDFERGLHTNEDLAAHANKARIVWLPLYLYDHGGITMKTSPFSCKWDSGQVGVIYMTYADILKTFDIHPIKPEAWEPNDDTRAKAVALLEAEVSEYDQYLRGDVYVVSVYEPADGEEAFLEDEDPHWQDDPVECVGMIFGDDYALQSGKEMVDAIVDQG